jgi:hypothetical protein
MKCLGTNRFVDGGELGSVERLRSRDNDADRDHGCDAGNDGEDESSDWCLGAEEGGYGAAGLDEVDDARGDADRDSHGRSDEREARKVVARPTRDE